MASYTFNNVTNVNWITSVLAARVWMLSMAIYTFTSVNWITSVLAAQNAASQYAR